VCRYQLQRRLKVTYRLHEGAFEIGAKASQHSDLTDVLDQRDRDYCIAVI
jgi:hypothetical protein